jgi:hypothetical protein
MDVLGVSSRLTRRQAKFASAPTDAIDRARNVNADARRNVLQLRMY